MAKTHLDSVYRAYGDTGDGHAGEYMTANLKTAHGERIPEDRLGGHPDSAEVHRRGHERETKGGNEAELHEGERYGVPKLVEYDLASI